MTYDTARTKSLEQIAKLAPALSPNPNEAFRQIFWHLAALPREEVSTVAAFLVLQECGRRAVSDLPQLLGEQG